MPRSGSRGPAAGPALVGVAAVGVLSTAVRASGPVLSGPDPTWHWDLGRRIIRHWLPAEDPYSFLTAGRDWILNQWGTEALIGLVDAVGGLWLVAVATALLVGGIFFHVGWRMWRRTSSLLVIPVLGLVYAASMSNLTLRGNLFTYLLLPLLLAELQRDDAPRFRVVIPVMAIWANLHAAFLMGLALMAIHGAGCVLSRPHGQRLEVLRRRGSLFLAATAATVVTPYGPALLVQSLGLALHGGGSGISEWAPPSLTATTVLPFTTLVAAGLVAMAVVASRDDLPDVLVVVAFTLLGASAIRNLAPASIVVGIVAAPYIHAAVRELLDHGPVPPAGPVRLLDRVASTLLLVVAVVLALVLVPASGSLRPHLGLAPVRAIAGLAEVDRPVRAYVGSLWTPAVSILGGEHVRTAVDGRLELFTEEEIQQATTLLAADPGWEEQLEDWCITDVIVSPDSPVGTYLDERDGWARVLISDVANQPEEEAVWHHRTMPYAEC